MIRSAKRVPARLARERAASGRCLLVCAYEDVLACNEILVKNAIPLAELNARLGTLGRDQEIVFYCASEGQETALRRADEFRRKGFLHASALRGGSDAWTALGPPCSCGD